MFESELWGQVRSTAPLCSWVATMWRRGLVSNVQADSLRSTGPILDLPQALHQFLLDLVLWIASSIRTVGQRAGGSERADQGPPMRSPVQLAREYVDLQYLDDTAGVAEFGLFSTSTRDCLVRVMDGGRHWEPSRRGGGTFSPLQTTWRMCAQRCLGG